MQNRTSIGERMVARHKLAQIVQDQYIMRKYPSIVQSCFKTALQIEKEIMPPRLRRNKVVNDKNKHKQARA